MHDEKKIKEIAVKYVLGDHEALTDNQEIKDLSEHIKQYAEHMVQQERERMISIIKKVRLSNHDLTSFGDGHERATTDILNAINQE